MVDKNRNGISDHLEPKYRAGQPTKGPNGETIKRAGRNPFWAGVETIGGPLASMGIDTARQGLNFFRDLGDFTTSSEDRIGTGFGDQLFGVPRNYYEDRARLGERPNSDWVGKIGGAIGNFANQHRPAAAEEMGLLDYLAQAGGVVDQLGIGGGGAPAVDYSGAMSQARGTRDRNSAYLAALYNQLRGGLAEDREGIADNYGGAIDRSQQIAATAQEATRGAYDSAQAKQDEAANALGMQQAAASQQLDRPTTQQQAADAIADSAARAQNAQTQYNSQQANATTHNKNVESASRFSEVRAQGDLDASLAERLNEYAQLQAEANAQAAASGQAAQSQRASAILSLAQNLYGDSQSRSQQDFENQLAAAEIANEQQQPAPGYTLEQLLAGQEASGLNTQDYTSFMKLLAQLNR